MSYGTPHDTNSDLGYGRTSSRLHKPRQMSSTYPYIEDTDVPEYEDEETEASIHLKTNYPVRLDTYSLGGSGPFYFVAGNTKLSDCFERPDKVLKEIHALGDSMSPIPMRTKKVSFGRGAGSSFPSGVGSFKRTGSKRGYFSSPPRNKIDDNIEDEDLNISNLKDLADKQEKQKGTFSAR